MIHKTHKDLKPGDLIRFHDKSWNFCSKSWNPYFQGFGIIIKLNNDIITWYCFNKMILYKDNRRWIEDSIMKVED